MHISDFDYELPRELIARSPAEPRDNSRMMVLNSTSGNIINSQFRNFPDYLQPSDVLVLNNTRVIRARTRARLERHDGTSRQMEVFFAEPAGPHLWQVLCKPGRRIRPGDRAVFGDGQYSGTFQKSLGSDLHLLKIDSAEEVLSAFGEMPLPPYLERSPVPADDVNYQTVFGVHSGAIAAPTAGLHFTSDILDAVRARGIEIVSITLHVGIGTFLPVRSDNPKEHKLRPERYEVSVSAAEALQAAIQDRRRIIAVGTTTLRTLEFLMLRDGRIQAGSGLADLYILPGFRFQAVNGLLTNFHLPKSTLLMLVSAFAGHATIMKAYRRAVQAGYRFYSYGDCMFINGDA